MRRTMVVSVFAGCGKTWLTNHQNQYGYSMRDSDSSTYEKTAGWEKEYINSFMEEAKSGKYDFIFVCQTESVIDEMDMRKFVEEETDKIPKFCITLTADSIIPKFQKQWLDKYYPGKITDLVGISSPERKMKTMQIIASAYDVPINDVLFVDGERDKVAQAIECGFCGMTTIEVMTKMYEKYGEKH